MSKRIERRIEEIKKERIALLEMVKENLANSGSDYSEYLKEIFGALKIDEDSMKRYSTYVDAQNMIITLTQEVLQAKSKDEVIKLRSKINYYINKIKDEIKKRNINTTTLERYQEVSGSLRNQIAKTIRILKREDNLSEIDSLYARIEELNEEELNKLKKALQREKRFNSNFNKPVIKKKIKKTKEGDIVFDLSKALDNIIEESSQGIKYGYSYKDKPLIIDVEDKSVTATPKEEPESDLFAGLTEYLDKIKEESHSSHTFVDVSDKDFEEVRADIIRGYESLAYRYNIRETHDYGDKRSKNFVSFIRNIPRIVHNKRAIRRMEKDYGNFYRGSDLVGIMEYQRERNSVGDALKYVFSKSHLKSQKTKYLKRHDDCSKWLYDFFKRNSLSIPVSKSYQF